MPSGRRSQNRARLESEGPFNTTCPLDARPPQPVGLHGGWSSPAPQALDPTCPADTWAGTICPAAPSSSILPSHSGPWQGRPFWEVPNTPQGWWFQPACPSESSVDPGSQGAHLLRRQGPPVVSAGLWWLWTAMAQGHSLSGRCSLISFAAGGSQRGRLCSSRPAGRPLRNRRHCFS